MPQSHIPLLWAAVSAIAMILSAPLSALSDKVGRFRVLIIGYIAYALFYMAMGLISANGALLFALFGFYGVFLAATEGVEKALVADLAPKGLQGSAFGLFNMTAGIMLLPASIVFGYLYEASGPTTAFLFSGCCSTLAAILLATWVFRGGEIKKT
mgnify:CR=1 FL=1